MRAKDAPDNLIPGAKPMPKNMVFNRAPGTVPQPRPSYTAAAAAPGGSGLNRAPGAASLGQHQAGARPPLPLDPQGKVDLDRLELPPGVSITKLNGPVPERRYFPSKPNQPGQAEEYLPLPGQYN